MDSFLYLLVLVFFYLLRIYNKTRKITLFIVAHGKEYPGQLIYYHTKEVRMVYSQQCSGLENIEDDRTIKARYKAFSTPCKTDSTYHSLEQSFYLLSRLPNEHILHLPKLRNSFYIIHIYPDDFYDILLHKFEESSRKIVESIVGTLCDNTSIKDLPQNIDIFINKLVKSIPEDQKIGHWLLNRKHDLIQYIKETVVQLHDLHDKQVHVISNCKLNNKCKIVRPTYQRQYQFHATYNLSKEEIEQSYYGLHVIYDREHPGIQQDELSDKNNIFVCGAISNNGDVIVRDKRILQGRIKELSIRFNQYIKNRGRMGDISTVIYLTDIIDFFIEEGYHVINIIDTACRTYANEPIIKVVENTDFDHTL
jgi:hypothetical protein